MVEASSKTLQMTVVKNFRDYVNNFWQKTIALAQVSNAVFCAYIFLSSNYYKLNSINQNTRRFFTSCLYPFLSLIRSFRRTFEGQTTHLTVINYINHFKFIKGEMILVFHQLSIPQSFLPCCRPFNVGWSTRERWMFIYGRQLSIWYRWMSI